jgi:colanic acid biosynthesis glycosyl transferase WcaI
MRILVLAPYYAPDIGPSAPLFTMLSEELAKRGHQVKVIAAVPHYPSGEVPVAFRGHTIRRSAENGVEVIRVPLPSLERANLKKRLLQFISYQVGATWALRGQKFDVALVANPALWVCLPFAWLVGVKRTPAVFSIHDVYPDVGITLGIFRNRPVIAAVAGLERFCLERSSWVRILSNSFRAGVNRLGVPDGKMALIYDWVDTDLIRPLPRNNPFASEHQMTDEFVVLYAGNLGMSQGLEHVLTAAERVLDHSDIRFVFVGGGAGRGRLVAEAERRKLKNVKFFPFQPRERLPEVLASADISLVTLQRGIGTGSLPSKTFSIFASGRPVVVCVDEGSETWELVKRAEAGLCVPPDDPAELIKAIFALKADPGLRERLGRNGRTWAERYHSPQSAALHFEELLLKATGSEFSCSSYEKRESS